jgi:hypothetical protein
LIVRVRTSEHWASGDAEKVKAERDPRAGVSPTAALISTELTNTAHSRTR